MYAWARPRIAIPVHGEQRHIREHVKLALELQVPEAIGPTNGDLVRLAPGPAAIIDEVPAGRLYVDGANIVPAEDNALKDRRRLGAEGAVHVTLALGEKNSIVAGPTISVRGISMADEEDFELALEELQEVAEAAFKRLKREEREDDDAVEGALMRAVRKAAQTLWRKRPIVDVSVLRL